MKTIEDLTPEEQAEAEQLVVDLRARGYEPREHFNELTRGARVRGHGQRYPSAYTEGTGVVVALVECKLSSWSQVTGLPDVEVVVAYDRPLFKGASRLSTISHYHVRAVSGAHLNEGGGQ